MQNTRFVAESGTQEVVITRVFDVTPDIVFSAYTDPHLIPMWWGAKMFTTIVDRLDLRPGGIWRFIERDNVGNEYAHRGVYHEIVVPDHLAESVITPSKQAAKTLAGQDKAGLSGRLVYTFEFEGIPGHILMETVTFEGVERNLSQFRIGKTKLTNHLVFQNTKDRDHKIKAGMEEEVEERSRRLTELFGVMVAPVPENSVTIEA